jgi:hypothetical protein
MPSQAELERQVAEVRKIVEYHRALVDEIRRKGLPTAAAEETLRGFERSLAVLEEREKAVRSGNAK